MGLLSKRKTKKEAKKAQAATKTATAEAKAAAQAAAAVPVGEIEIPHRQQQIATNLSVPKGGRSGGGGVRGRGFRFRRRAVKSRKYDSSRGGGAGSPSDKSHHSVVSALSKDTGFPETPKRRLFQQPDPVDLLPSMHGDEADSGDLFKMPGLRTAEQAATKAKAATNSAVTETKTEVASEKTKKKKKTGNIWTRSKNFKKLTDWAFKTIDADGSGQVDKKELYTGMLMIHLKLATYAGPAACRPATREYCEKIFDRMDVDHSGELDREEFEEVMQIVCAQVFSRVIIQWSMTLMVVPMIAQLIIKMLISMNNVAWGFWMEIDEFDPMRATISNVSSKVWNKILSFTPGFIQTILGMTVGKVDDVWAKVPDGIKETLPVTLMSCILSCLLVPYIIYKMDEYHEQRAEKKGKELKEVKAEEG